MIEFRLGSKRADPECGGEPFDDVVGAPVGAGFYSNLRVDLSYNQLDYLPEAIGELDRLEVLHLQGNCLRGWPESMGQLHKLRVLNIYENQLTEIPLPVARLPRLEFLDASRNLISRIPQENASWHAMRWLVLSGNPLDDLPEGFLPECVTFVSRRNAQS